MRITDDHRRAHEALDRAEAAARAHDLAAELARVHYLRGSLHFPRGDLEGCLREHGLALGHARRARLPEVEAQALSGPGDAEYGRGRMVSAHGYFRRCVALAREHGLGRIEVANLGAAGLTRLYLGDPRGAADDLLAAAGATVGVGNRRAELVHRLDAALALWELGEADRARDQVDQAMALVRALGARRFEAEGLLLEARLLHDEGLRPEALGSLERAAASSRETGIAYHGAAIAGEIAAVTDTADAREAVLAEGEALLAAGAVSHNHLWFRRRAMDATLRAGDWGAVERHATALDEYTCSERLPWADFFVARGRALAAQGRSLRGTTPTTSEPGRPAGRCPSDGLQARATAARGRARFGVSRAAPSRLGTGRGSPGEAQLPPSRAPYPGPRPGCAPWPTENRP
jgi:tetratricopeptide (TPR) repeat protein